MEIKNIFKCRYCDGLAHEYVGLEGGRYIGAETPFHCDKNKDGFHRFTVKGKKSEGIIIEVSEDKKRFRVAVTKSHGKYVPIRRSFSTDTTKPFICYAGGNHQLDVGQRIEFVNF